MYICIYVYMFIYVDTHMNIMILYDFIARKVHAPWALNCNYVPRGRISLSYNKYTPISIYALQYNIYIYICICKCIYIHIYIYTYKYHDFL